jgi:putative hydrolase
VSQPDPFGGLFGGEPGDLAGALRRMADLLQGAGSGGGPVDWALAGNIARQAVAGDDPSPGPAEQAATDAALRLADLWLDAVTALPSGITHAEAWSRAQWVESTKATWQQLTDPVAARMVEAFAQSVPEEARASLGPVLGMLNQVGGLVFGAQVGQGVGALAAEVLSASDIGVPLGPTGVAALLPASVERWAADLSLPLDEVRLHVALREAAHQRLFVHVPWLRSHLHGAVEAYARGIHVDREALERAVQEVDMTRPEALQEALAGGLFAPQDTPEQTAALARLETGLALVEGWVDHVVAAAAATRLPSAAAQREAQRRRRAAGGPAEQAFATLVGLELRPRKLREAAELWGELMRIRGVDGRDAIWEHPDLLPDATDLDDPAGYAERSAPLDLSSLDDAGEPPSENNAH